MGEKEWTGIILAGGLSSRMGTNKALLELNGSVMLAHVAEAMKLEASSLIVAAGPNVAIYSDMGYRCVQDQYSEKGPLAGLHAALQASETDWNLVCACDMPLVQTSFFNGIKMLTKQYPTSNAIIPRVEGRVHPLAGAYHRRVVPDLEQYLVQNRLGVIRWLEEIGCHYADTDELEQVGIQHAALQLSNMNTPEQFEHIRSQGSRVCSDG